MGWTAPRTDSESNKLTITVDAGNQTDNVVAQIVGPGMVQLRLKTSVWTGDVIRVNPLLVGSTGSRYNIGQQTTSQEDVSMTGILDRYIVRDRDSVIAFIKQHPGLAPLVQEAYDVIARQFGANAQVTLTIEMDDSPELWAEITTDLPADDAYDKLQEITLSWYADRADQLLRRFNFDLEFA